MTHLALEWSRAEWGGGGPLAEGIHGGRPNGVDFPVAAGKQAL